MKSIIRLGFIGAGSNTRAKHLPLFQKIPGLELAAVCNRTARAAEAAGRAGVGTVTQVPREGDDGGGREEAGVEHGAMCGVAAESASTRCVMCGSTTPNAMTNARQRRDCNLGWRCEEEGGGRTKLAR